MSATDRPSFVYVIYIRATPEQVWRGLTDPDFTERYWGGVRITSDWKVGGPVALMVDGKAMDTGEVLEYDPFNRLSYSWKVNHSGFENEPPSRATFELRQLGEQVEVRFVHDRFEPGSGVLAAVSNGWPVLFSSLKSLLETGKVLTVGMSAHERPYALENA